jgi:hypothetical protein
MARASHWEAREAQRMVNLLVRRHLTEEHIEQIAIILRLLLGPRENVRMLRRKMREKKTGGTMCQRWREK